MRTLSGLARSMTAGVRAENMSMVLIEDRVSYELPTRPLRVKPTILRMYTSTMMAVNNIFSHLCL